MNSQRPRDSRTEASDERLRTLLGEAPAGVSVVAHGGYGRGELGPRSDLDVLLLHDGIEDISRIADRLWYPLWDSGVRLDHSVRTIPETLHAAGRELRTALSLLDSRHVAGDPSLTLRLRTGVLADWRRRAPRRLPDLEVAARERAARVGELASMLEPDVKEAFGGLRDGVVLRAVAASWLVEVPHGALARVRTELLDVRDAVHDAGGTGDRLLAELQDDVAARLGFDTREALLRSVFGAGRRLAYLSDLVWRRTDRALSRFRRSRSPREIARIPRVPGSSSGIRAISRTEFVQSRDGEIGLTANAPVGSDPLLALRAAHAAASRELMLSPYAAERLATSYLPMPEPWPDEARRLFTGLLGTGAALLPVWEALDQAGLIDGLVPEWSAVRCAPQYSPVHRHTVDRHLLETCREGSALVGGVARPDLLLVACLLHDIGKTRGVDGPDHANAGATRTRDIATRMGYDREDVAVLVGLVRNHLLLMNTATQRDLDDPTTVKTVAVEVGDADHLDLLAALTEADARATGGAAWTPWRARLLTKAVERVRARLERGATPRPAELEPWQAKLAGRPGIHIVVSGNRLTIASAAPLAAVAGVLASFGLSVRSAAIHPGVSVFWVEGEPPPATVVRDRLHAAGEGSFDIAGAISPYGETGLTARVIPGASKTATVLEVLAPDSPGLFYRICTALAGAGAAIRSAHVSTLAGQAVDVFYLEPGVPEKDLLAAMSSGARDGLPDHGTTR